MITEKQKNARLKQLAERVAPAFNDVVEEVLDQPIDDELRIIIGDAVLEGMRTHIETLQGQQRNWHHDKK